MIELTQEQRLAVSAEQNPMVLDPQTNAEYVLVRKELFDRIKGLLYDDSEMTHQNLRLLLAQSSQENGWEEPEMRDYDRYDELRK